MEAARGTTRKGDFPMTNNLPDVQPASLPATLFGQAALFEDSDQLLALTDAQLRHLAALVGEDAESGLAQMRRRFGLLAWAGWLRFEGKPYEEYVAALARYVGVSPRTVKSWRDIVVEKQRLAVPPATDQRRKEAAEREEKSRSGQVRAGKQHGNRFIPADSTEALDKSSEGDGHNGVECSTPRGPTPSDPSSGGAELQRPAPPTDEAAPKRPSSRSAPPDPPERPPSNRVLASRVVAAMRDIDPVDAGRVLPADEATFVRQWAQRTLDAWKAVYAPPAPAEKPERRQGYSRPAQPKPEPITRPQAAVIAGRAVTAPAVDLTRREVAPMFKKGAK